MCARGARAILPGMTLGRRKLLLIGSGAVCAHALGCGNDTGTALSPVIDAGNEANLAVGTLRAIANHGAAIGRDAAGIFAISLICTHAGCDMSADGAIGRVWSDGATVLATVLRPEAGVYASGDGGASWTFAPGSFDFREVVFGKGRVWARGATRVYWSDDSGKSWTWIEVVRGGDWLDAM